MKSLPILLASILLETSLLIVYSLLSTTSPSFAQDEAPAPPPPPTIPAIPYGVGGETQFFSTEKFKKLALPQSLQDKFIGKEAKGSSEEFSASAKFWQAAFVPGKSVEPTKPEEEKNFLQAFWDNIVSFFQALFAPAASEKGFLRTVRTDDLFIPASADQAAITAIFKETSLDFQNSIYPANFNPFRYTSPLPPTALRPQTQEIATLFRDAAASQCVPEAVLLAIARTEAGGTFSYSTSEVQRFSTPGWWTEPGISQQELTRGYCYDTCAQPGITCVSGANVMGAMQFELGTWNSLVPSIKSVLQRNYGLPGTYEPNRCNLRDVIVAAAIKLKGDSGTAPNQCTSWSETTIRSVALSSCGSCGTQGCTNPRNPPSSCSAACGTDYCQNVWSLSQSY